MVDEIVYSELAKNVAAHGQFLVRGVPSHGYGFVYPVLIAPAWRLFASIPDAYTAAKAINAVLMSLAAIPAYFLARRRAAGGPLAGRRRAHRARALDALHGDADDGERVLPALPARGVPARADARAADRRSVRSRCSPSARSRSRPARRRSRSFAAVATAPILLALVERRGVRGDAAPLRLALRPPRRRRRRSRSLGTIAAGRSPLTLLGAYRAATSSTLHGRAASSTSSSTTSPSSTSTSASSRSRRSSPSGSRRGARRPAPAPSRSPRSRSRVWLLAEVAAFASRASSTGSRSGTCSTSRRSR